MHTMLSPAHTKIYKSPPRRIKRSPSPAQQQRRYAFMDCTIFWHTTVTVADVTRWQLYADRHHYTNRKGQTIRLTAWSAFLHINLYRAFSGVSLLAAPPEA